MSDGIKFPSVDRVVPRMVNHYYHIFHIYVEILLCGNPIFGEILFWEGVVSYRNDNTDTRRYAYCKRCCRVGAVGGKQWEVESWVTNCRSEPW